MNAAAIPVPERINNKVKGEFYPLQRQELLALKQAGIINNAAYVHMALRCENPFCDRPVEIIPKEFAQRWNLPESSVYDAIARLKKLGILAIRTGKLLLNWVLSNPQATPDRSNDASSEDGNYAQPASNCRENVDTKTISDEVSNHAESLRDRETNYETLNSILGSQNQFEISENRELKSLPEKDFSSSQTIQINSEFNQTLSEANEKENFYSTQEEAKNHSESLANNQKLFQQHLNEQKDLESDLNSAAPRNKNLQIDRDLPTSSVSCDEDDSSYKDGRFSPQYRKILEALPEAKDYLTWAYKHCGDGLLAYPTYPSKVIENNHHDLYNRYRQEREKRDAIARSIPTQSATEKSPTQRIIADHKTVLKLAREAMQRVRP